MKKIFFFLLIATGLYAQSVYGVVPGTTGNELALGIVNESQTTGAENVTVALINNPRGIETNNTLFKIETLKAGEEKQALFSFNVKRIPGVQKDTLKFLITNAKGGNWKKEIILAYSLPKEFKLEQNYPNPFNPSTTIEFAIPQSGRYSLTVYNILGQLVKLISEDEYEAGYYKVNFDASLLASGMYFYVLTGNNINISKKMILLK